MDDFIDTSQYCDDIKIDPELLTEDTISHIKKLLDEYENPLGCEDSETGIIYTMTSVKHKFEKELSMENESTVFPDGIEPTLYEIDGNNGNDGNEILKLMPFIIMNVLEHDLTKYKNRYFMWFKNEFIRLKFTDGKLIIPYSKLKSVRGDRVPASIYWNTCKHICVRLINGEFDDDSLDQKYLTIPIVIE